MKITRLEIAACAALVVLVWLPRTRAAADVYHVDPSKSHVTIAVGKAGAFSLFAGHTHEVTGPVQDGTVEVDSGDPSRSHVRLVILAAALKVSGAAEPPEDRPRVQETMESDLVLDVARYPRIAFESTAVTIKRRNGAAMDLVVDGDLTIRGNSHSVSVPVRVDLSDRALTANGRLTIKQTAFGIKPVSVAGVVSVKDALDIAFSIAARR